MKNARLRAPGRLLLASALISLLAGCVTPPHGSDAPSPITVTVGSEDSFGALLTGIGSLLPAADAGAMVGVIQPGGVSIASVGNPAFSESTLFEFGSITKVVTTNILAQMLLEGAVTLDQSVFDLLPAELIGRGWDEVTLWHLATHSSGLSGFPPNRGPVRIFLTGQVSDPFAQYGESDLLNGMKRTRRPRMEEEWGYSNYAFAVLGYLLARQSGMEFNRLVELRLLKPLGMETATMSGWSSADIAPPLRQSGRPGNNWDFRSFAPAGALRGSIRDGLALLSASINACDSDDPISAANCLAQRSAGFAVGTAAEMGLGWVRSTVGESLVIWHNGGTGGYSTFLGFNPESREGVVILTNVNGLREIDSLAKNHLSGLNE